MVSPIDPVKSTGCLVAKGQFCMLLLVAILLPILFVDALAPGCLCMTVHGWTYGIYLGPLWRDNILANSTAGPLLLPVLLYPACGLVGLFSAMCVTSICRNQNLLWVALQWAVLTAIGLFGFGLAGLGPLGPPCR